MTILTDLVKRGDIPLTRIDESTRRVLALKKELGLFENNGVVPLASNLLAMVGQQADIDASRDMARGNIVLLQNGISKNAGMCCRGKASASDSGIQSSVDWLKCCGGLGTVPPQASRSLRAYFDALADLYYQASPDPNPDPNNDANVDADDGAIIR